MIQQKTFNFRDQCAHSTSQAKLYWVVIYFDTNSVLRCGGCAWKQTGISWHHWYKIYLWIKHRVDIHFKCFSISFSAVMRSLSQWSISQTSSFHIEPHEIQQYFNWVVYLYLRVWMVVFRLLAAAGWSSYTVDGVDGQAQQINKKCPCTNAENYPGLCYFHQGVKGLLLAYMHLL